MPEEKKPVEPNKGPQTSVSGEGSPSENSAKDYLDAIKDLKSNSVPKSEYDKLREEKKQLLKALTEGGQTVEVNTSTPDKTSAELREEILKSHGDLNNLEGWKKTLEYREACLREGKEDPLIIRNPNKGITREDVESAEAFAQEMQDCIDRCNNDPRIFNAECRRKSR